MPLQKSNLNKNLIIEILKIEYGIEVINIQELNRGSSNIFIIYSQNNKYILKEFQNKRNKNTIEKEVKIINFLKTRNINVPTYIKTKNDKYYIENANRVIILQEYIEGYNLKNNNANYEQILESSRILGKLVKELSDYQKLNDDNIIEEQFSINALESGIVNMKNLRKEIHEDNIYKERIFSDINYKIKISKELVKKFDFNIINKITITNSHGDYCVEQLIYRNNNEAVVIDFEKAKSLPIVWEIMRSYSYIDKTALNGKLNIDYMVDYFKEFNKYFKLNENDLKYAPHIYLLQLIRSIFGYKEYNNDYSKKSLIEFALFRTRLCKYLYENLNEISERLIKEVKT